MDTMVKLGARLACSPDMAQSVIQDLESLTVALPTRKACVAWKGRLDIIAMMWERAWAASHVTWRYIQVDGSPQHGWNFVNSRSEELSFPLGSSDLDILVALESHTYKFRRRTLTPMSVGYTRAKLADKLDILGRQLMLDSHSDKSGFDKVRCEVCNSITDQATERGLADGPNLVGDLEGIKVDMTSVLRGDVDMGSPAVAKSRLLPNCISTTDALHIMFGGLEESLKALPAWAEVETSLRDIANFLRNRLLRWAFMARCVPDAPTREKFKKWSSTLIDWEFEFLERLLDPMCVILDSFVELYDANKVRGAAVVAAGREAMDGHEEARKAASKAVTKAGEACDVRLLGVKAIAFLVIARIVGKYARWFEGCHCHEEVWTAQVSRKRKLEKFQQLVPGQTECIHKNRRATDMALGAIVDIRAAIQGATSPELDSRLATLSHLDRSYVLAFLQQLRDNLCEYYTAKFFYYGQPPLFLQLSTGHGSGIMKVLSRRPLRSLRRSETWRVVAC